ncbi:MAG: peroxiredoxin [bacterium]
MARADNLYELPGDLPVPIDDGACAHLLGMRIPSVPLMSTSGRLVDLAHPPGVTVVYCYPRTGRPDVEPPKGWNDIPGARGCTPQSCAFRDLYQEMRALGAEVLGVSTQTTEEQQEAARRLRLPFDLLSDAGLQFARALRLPTFQVDSITCIKRLTLVIHDRRIERVFYPVFPPDKNAAEVVGWLSRRGGRPA